MKFPVLMVLGSAALIAGEAAAQVDFQPADPELRLELPSETDEEPSELDLLSRTDEDAFPQIDSDVARTPVSVTVRALNKVTAKFIDLEIAMDETAEFGSLTITAKYCDKRPPEEFPETSAFLQISDGGAGKSFKVKPTPDETSLPPQAENADADAFLATAHNEATIFSGWMFASSPGLNSLEHPVYDVWVIDCATIADDSM